MVIESSSNEIWASPKTAHLTSKNFNQKVFQFFTKLLGKDC